MTSVPLLERLKFLAISASNLDEFFMVRVGGLKLVIKQDGPLSDPSGMTAREQLEAVSRRVHRMSADQYACFLDLEPQLAQAGVRRLRRGRPLTNARNRSPPSSSRTKSPRS